MDFVEPWQNIDQVLAIQAANAQVYTYPGAGHWFVEVNRPDNYQPKAAELGCQRSLKFLGE